MDYRNTQTIQELRQILGMSQSQFSQYFEIPVRTLQEWEQGRRKPPIYLLKLMVRILEAEKPES